MTFMLFAQGVGHRDAKWESRYGALAGPFLYLLESDNSKSYKTYHSYATHSLGMIVVKHMFISLRTSLFGVECEVKGYYFLAFYYGNVHFYSILTIFLLCFVV